MTPVELREPQACYACYENDEADRLKSSSGGLATALARNVIMQGGVVYGSAFIPPMGVGHVRCSTLDDIQRLRGSKYVQSSTEGIFQQIRADLKQGLQVMFLGTPCQTAAVKAAFRKYDNLTVVDLVCHGVPSMQFLRDTLPQSVVDAEKETMEFRASTKYHFSLRNGISTIYERPLHKDLYMKGFFNGVLFRPSCFTCRYAQRKRASDMTVGDFWGLKSTTMKDDGKGISLALVNTDKGKVLFDAVRSGMTVEKRPVDEGIAGNGQLNRPFQRNLREKIFKRLYPHLGYMLSLWAALPDKILGTKVKTVLKRLK